MTDTTKALQDLLERAVALSEAAAEVKEAGLVEAPVTPSAGAVEAAAESGVSLEALADKIAMLEDTIFALQNSTPEPVAAEAAAAAEEPAAVTPDFADQSFDDETAEAEEKAAKAFAPCPECGSTNVDEFKDGTARCEDCGEPLKPVEGKDFDDLELKELGLDDAELDELFGAAPEEGSETKDGAVDLETKGDTDTLTEMELLLARRAQLDA